MSGLVSVRREPRLSIARTSGRSADNSIAGPAGNIELFFADFRAITQSNGLLSRHGTTTVGRQMHSDKLMALYRSKSPRSETGSVTSTGASEWAAARKTLG